MKTRTKFLLAFAAALLMGATGRMAGNILIVDQVTALNTAKAGVVFDGDSAPCNGVPPVACTLLDSLNVTSVTKTATGAYTAELTTAMSDSDYNITIGIDAFTLCTASPTDADTASILCFDVLTGAAKDANRPSFVFADFQ